MDQLSATAVLTPFDMSDETEETTSAASPTAILDLYRLVSPWIAPTPWLLPLTVVLGLIASAAEGAGVAGLLLLGSALLGSSAQSDLDGPFRKIVDTVLQRTGDDPLLIGALVAGLVLGRIAVMALHQVVASQVEARISHQVRRRLFDAILDMPMVELDRRTFGGLMTVLDRYSWSVTEAIDSIGNMIISACVAMVLALALLAIAPLVALIAALGVFGLLLVTRLLMAPAERAGIAAATAARDVSTEALRVVQAIRAIRVYGAAPAFRNRFDRTSYRLRSATVRADIITALSDPLSHIAFLAMIVITALCAGWFGASLATTVAGLALLYRFQPYAAEFEGQRLHCATLLEPVRAVKELADRSGPPTCGRQIEVVYRDVHFRDVTFVHEGQTEPCVKGANFRIPAGWVLIEGNSGAGKSTLINLLLGLYRPQSGEILADGVSITDIAEADWLAGIALSGQDVELIDGSIVENLLPGLDGACGGDLEMALRVSGLDDVIAALPEGLETRIGERGLYLSGGQRQRLGIARAILKRPQMLILDEATSALDQEAERSIFTGLVPLMEGRTVILICHRMPEGLPIGTILSLSGDGQIVSDGEQV